MTGWFIIYGAYAIFAVLACTFLWALSKHNWNPDFTRRDRYGYRESWRKRETKSFFLTLSGLVWPLWIPVVVVLLTFKLAVPILKKLVEIWEYLIKEVENPRENV